MDLSPKAVHEAGHAVAIISLGGEFAVVDAKGRAFFDGETTTYTQAFVSGYMGVSSRDDADALVSLAGTVAERLAQPERVRAYLRSLGKDQSDAEWVSNVMEGKNSSDLRWYSRVTARKRVSADDAEAALEFMRERMSQVLAVAKALVASDNGQLTYEQVVRLVAGSGDAPDESCEN